MALKDKITTDLKNAMKSRQKDRIRVLRSLKAGILEKEISVRKDGEAELSDQQVTEVLMKAAKQRKDSVEQFKEGGREDLVQNEQKELRIIESYLPEMLDEDEIREIARKKIDAIGAKDLSDMGKVMGALMQQLKGKADGAKVSKVVKEELS
jgi:uncharacterized protein YqeY